MLKITIFLLMLLSVVYCNPIYKCNCLDVHVTFDNDDNLCSDTCHEQTTFNYTFSNNYHKCKDISNVVFDFDSNTNIFPFYNISNCITEIDDVDPPCHRNGTHPLKFDFGNCSTIAFTVNNTKIAIGKLHYKAGTECFECDIPVPIPCFNDEIEEEDDGIPDFSAANGIVSWYYFIKN